MSRERKSIERGSPFVFFPLPALGKGLASAVRLITAAAGERIMKVAFMAWVQLLFGDDGYQAMRVLRVSAGFWTQLLRFLSKQSPA
jgi:hypothetical protein